MIIVKMIIGIGNQGQPYIKTKLISITRFVYLIKDFKLKQLEICVKCIFAKSYLIVLSCTSHQTWSFRLNKNASNCLFDSIDRPSTICPTGSIVLLVFFYKCFYYCWRQLNLIQSLSNTATYHNVCQLKHQSCIWSIFPFMLKLIETIRVLIKRCIFYHPVTETTIFLLCQLTF